MEGCTFEERLGKRDVGVDQEVGEEGVLVRNSVRHIMAPAKMGVGVMPLSSGNCGDETWRYLWCPHGLIT